MLIFPMVLHADQRGNLKCFRKNQESRVAVLEGNSQDSLKERADEVPDDSKDEIGPTGCCDNDRQGPTDRKQASWRVLLAGWP
jgi:hypothetical protein